MKYFWIIAFMLISSCGALEKDDDKPEKQQNSEDLLPNAPVSPGPQGPKGEAGANGRDGTNGSNGSDGSTGATGSVGGVLLYDALDRTVGVKFDEEAGGIAHVILLDHAHAKFDRYSGALRAPHDNISCMYQTGDCTGTCYVYDRRWLGFVVADALGKTYVASRTTPDTGSLDMYSYVDGNGVCQAAAISTIESFATTVYTPSGFTLPLAAPLYWDIAK
jgi:hypothetical protein